MVSQNVNGLSLNVVNVVHVDRIFHWGRLKRQCLPITFVAD